MQTYGYRQHKDPPKWLRFVRHKKLAILLGVVFITVILITFSNKGLLRRFLLESDVAEKKESIENIREDIRALKERRHLLKTSMFEIERVAREEHGMIKPGETVYYITSESDEDSE